MRAGVMENLGGVASSEHAYRRRRIKAGTAREQIGCRERDGSTRARCGRIIGDPTMMAYAYKPSLMGAPFEFA